MNSNNKCLTPGRCSVQSGTYKGRCTRSEDAYDKILVHARTGAELQSRDARTYCTESCAGDRCSTPRLYNRSDLLTDRFDVLTDRFDFLTDQFDVLTDRFDFLTDQFAP